jgi:hypothetical protein
MFTGRRYVKWNEEDTQVIMDYFEKYFTGKGEGLKGSLPGKSGCVQFFFHTLHAFINYLCSLLPIHI